MNTKKIYLNIVLLIALIGQISAQNRVDYFYIQNFKTDVAITFNAQNRSSNVLSDYGSINSRVGNSINNYIFQGQEFDADLGLYFFPSRIYSATEKKFYQPDPKSQYHSSYLFVRADPVNIVDRNGNEGKPLVLYGQDHSHEMSIDDFVGPTLFDMDEEAYSVPLSDFLNGDVGDLPEWNGNVYINAHMDIDAGEEIVVERSMSKKRLISRKANVSSTYENFEHTVCTDAESLGKSLRRFSEERGVPIENITAGGCQGAHSAERIGQGYTSGGERFHGRTLTTRGTKPGNILYSAGEETTSELGVDLNFTKTQLGVHAKGHEMQENFKTVKNADGSEEQKFDSYLGTNEKGISYEVPYAEGDDVIQMSNGRIPKSISHEFETFHFEY